MAKKEPVLGEKLADLLTKVLTEGKDIQELIKRPWSVAKKLGVSFSAEERAFLDKVPIRSYIKQLYESLSKVDKRYRRALGAEKESASIPPTMVIPIVGVMVCCVVVAVVIVAGSPSSGTIADRSPDADDKL